VVLAEEIELKSIPAWKKGAWQAKVGEGIFFIYFFFFLLKKAANSKCFENVIV
jgi:hypothetical protein